MLCACVIFCTKDAGAQQKEVDVVDQDSVWVATLKSQLFRFNRFSMAIDSFKEKTDTNKVEEPKQKQAIRFNGGYLQYFLTYRSQIDTPYAESDVLQHMRTVNARFTINEMLPVSVTLFERTSNSTFFRDFFDVRIDVEGPELRRLQQEKTRKYLVKKIESLADSALLEQLDINRWNTNKLKLLLQQPDLMRWLIQSKEKLIYLHEKPATSTWRDSVKTYASNFIRQYEGKRGIMDSLLTRKDSLQGRYKQMTQQLGEMKAIASQPLISPANLKRLRQLMKQQKVPDPELPKVPGVFSSLKKLSLGRTIPDVSPLTVRNINVRGINGEWGNGQWYAAIVAGLVDFRLRDYVAVRSTRYPKQYVYAARAGWGAKEGNHIFFTGYKGSKQIYSYSKPAVAIAGISAEVQYVIRQRHRFTAEVAQSSAPVSTNDDNKGTPLRLNDRNATAYNISWRSVFPKLKATAEGNYQHAGIRFQSFNSYRANAATESWSVRYEQFLLKRQLRFTAAARKNDFFNPLIEQRYETNTVFTTLQLSFKRKNWPYISVGYMPSSQLVVMDSQVYETHYRSLTGMIAYAYRIGEARTSTNIFFNRFYNKGRDSVSLYNNAKHLSILQQFIFPRNTAMLGLTITNSPDFSMIVMQASAATVIVKRLQLELGARVHQLDRLVTKAGPFAKIQYSASWLGQLSISYDDGYLPGLKQHFFRNQQLTAGLTRFFK